MSVTFADVQAAAERLKGHAVETPLFESPALNERLGGRVLLKLETMQRVGAFKFRGAYNRLVQLDAEQRKAGVVAFSSGNHAQGVALAAKLLGMPAMIVMPSDAPAIKVEATRGYGAEIRLYDRINESREAISDEIAKSRGAVVVPAFDDPHIAAGQGTAGLEMMAQAKAANAVFDTLVSPVGGGGLLSGISLVVKELSPKTEIWGAEPSVYNDLAQSLASGAKVTIKPSTRTLCDALESPSTGDVTWPILKANLTGAVGLTDPEVAEAMRYAFQTLKLVIEPGGSVGLAALLTGKVDARGKTTGVVVSGGNVDPALFAKILRGEI
ncbi:threonine/serine dehydratase [Phenylobacterium sp.]|uniref:threonine ammonia-lyase n=1 Tax=Phenylobacterium sp. TaxID=1871053 RepID=UPI00122983D5|nr:threonine/serine dehydratase [Phenylobacterium sp.]THD51392.1 MAG: threonine/serine dehydratase [Phenylobacterium sp.]